MITLATYSINFFHPGFLLGKGNTWKNEKEVRGHANDVETPMGSEGRPSREKL